MEDEFESEVLEKLDQETEAAIAKRKSTHAKISVIISYALIF
jgi:hypothetical protein